MRIFLLYLISSIFLSVGSYIVYNLATGLILFGTMMFAAAMLAYLNGHH
jgi:hypothetical protein